jgi:hypothetical protein
VVVEPAVFIQLALPVALTEQHLQLDHYLLRLVVAVAVEIYLVNKMALMAVLAEVVI